jgi:hypothetical protein
MQAFSDIGTVEAEHNFAQQGPGDSGPRQMVFAEN